MQKLNIYLDKYEIKNIMMTRTFIGQQFWKPNANIAVGDLIPVYLINKDTSSYKSYNIIYPYFDIYLIKALNIISCEIGPPKYVFIIPLHFIFTLSVIFSTCFFIGILLTFKPTI